MRNLIKYKKGESSWVSWIKKRIENNLNFLGLAQGPTGIGKSWAMLSIAHQIDPDFNVNQIAFSFKEIMEIINADWFKQKKWKIILFDEAQTDISNREWQSLTNKLMNYLLSTFRHQNIILLFTSPYSDFLDSQSRKLLHCIFEIRGWSKKEKSTTIRPKIQQYNGRLKKFYEHSLYVWKNKEYQKLMYWKVGKPPKHLIDPYEEAKESFTSKLNKSILEQLMRIDPDKRKPLTDQQRSIMELIGKGLNQREVAEQLNISRPLVTIQKGLATKKGYNVEEFKENE